MPKNYYLVLGISSKATLDDIKGAYRRLVKEFHPDRYGENYSPFLAVQEAYTVLSDPLKRKDHDLSVAQHKKQRTRVSQRHTRYRPGKIEPLVPDQKPVQNMRAQHIVRSFNSYRPAFDQLFDRTVHNYGQSRRSKTAGSENQKLMIPLTPDQAFNGGQIRLSIPVEAICPSCSGYGWIGPHECWECSTAGTRSCVYPLMINYPPGIMDNHIVKVPLSHYGIKDHYLIVHFRIDDMKKKINIR